MRTYTIHKHFNQDYSKPEPVKKGFSFPCMIFGPWWTLSRKLWLNTILMFIFFPGMMAAPFFMEKGNLEVNLFALAMIGAWSAIPAFFANEWVRNKLTRKGYKEVAVVKAKSKVKAIQAYYDQNN